MQLHSTLLQAQNPTRFYYVYLNDKGKQRICMMQIDDLTKPIYNIIDASHNNIAKSPCNVLAEGNLYDFCKNNGSNEICTAFSNWFNKIKNSL